MKEPDNEDQADVKAAQSHFALCWAKNAPCNREHCMAWDKTYNRCKWVVLLDHLVQNV